GDPYKLVETDQIIIEIAGKSIPKIFAEDGEKTFREYEVMACRKASNLQKVVISCGGGVVLNEINIKNLKENCYIVLLNATEEEIYNRVMSDGKETRPIINKEDPKKEIEKVLTYRKPYYEKAAEFFVETSGKEIKNIVREIAIKTQIKA
ncbi:hypothetical protein LCGC14_2322620, partial [marine sediment metagenome]